ncbi:hypothetical protein B5G52_04115 [Pseudoalteromonas sp. A601]|uniref:recombinase family protein n=1 Tax=Pseudoalteromonas sp. A601 TaxID=1967839 RepID=UPI000B3C5985|nr:recombinase family protein [Pseudoalteromonas sp. A601]OUS73438.1 hypothetical protein B5G52_04115 [Pseudoalteromonas sp. A601]
MTTNSTTTNKYVIFYRVSSKQQGKSGLGLDAQKRDINIYLESYADKPFTILSEHTSIHSGSNIEDCQHFQEAIKACKTHNATLLVAKVDRLSRKVSVISKVIEEVDVKVACMPTAERFQLHIFAALAEEERAFISKRTKAALAEAKARGVKLGGNRIGSEKANEAKKVNANNRAEKYRNILNEIVKNNYSYAAVARVLTSVSKEDKHYQPIQAQRLMKRLGIELLPKPI